MRTSAVRAFTHRQLRGRTVMFDGTPTLALDGIEQLATAVAARTADPITVAAVYVHGLAEHGGWRRPQLVEAGIDTRLIDAAEGVRAEATARLRLSAKSLARGALIRDCRRTVPGPRAAMAEYWAWQRAEADLVRHGAPDAVGIRQLIADLESADPETAHYARVMCDRIRPAEAVEPLLAAADRLDPAQAHNGRLTLIQVAASCMTTAQLPLALRLVTYPDELLRDSAARVLRRLDDPAARAAVTEYDLQRLRPVLGLAEDEPTPRRPQEINRRLIALVTADPSHLGAVRALGRHGDASALPVLTAALGHRSSVLQRAADEAIEAIGGTEARRRAALAVLRDPTAAPDRAAHVAHRLELTEAVPELIAAIGRTNGVVHDVVVALTRLGATEAVPALVDAFRRAKWAQPMLITALTQLGPDPAVDLLLAEARNPLHGNRTLVMNALARCTDRRATDLVVTLLLNGVVRTELVRPLAERGDPELFDVLVELVNTTTNRKIRRLATHGIRRIAETDPALVERRIPWIREPISRTWLEPRLPDGPERLKRLEAATRDGDQRVRAQAVKSLALIGTSEAFAVIRQLREDPSRHVRACVEGTLPHRAPVADR
ncbi:HEAT repeat domain-containing protein [Kitasatospora sp. NPDC004614]|uniref:HEAT repeat domain-containing protein n=1 Tax=unclassified Kitasatospora TaxID=2633591 RepID=UPI00368212F6